VNGDGVLVALASAIHYNLIDIKAYAIVSVCKIPVFGGGK